MTKLHTLVDLENVHPKIEDLRKMVPRMTDACSTAPTRPSVPSR